MLDEDEFGTLGEALDPAERFFACPCCGARISVLLDLSVAAQRLIEDCEVCCRPLEIAYTVEGGEVAEFSAAGEQD